MPTYTVLATLKVDAGSEREAYAAVRALLRRNAVEYVDAEVVATTARCTVVEHGASGAQRCVKDAGHDGACVLGAPRGRCLVLEHGPDWPQVRHCVLNAGHDGACVFGPWERR